MFDAIFIRSALPAILWGLSSLHALPQTVPSLVRPAISPFENVPHFRTQESVIFLDQGGVNRVYLASSLTHLAHLRNHRIGTWISALSGDIRN